MTSWIPFAPLITSLVLFLSLLATIYNIHQTRDKQLYDYLARLWYDLHKLALDNPDFMDRTLTSVYQTSFVEGTDKRKRYELFARLYWAYIEDIYSNDYHKREYYKPTIRRAKDLHLSWLQQHSNDYLPEFTNFVTSFT